MNMNCKRFPRNEYYKKFKEDVFACKADGQTNGTALKKVQCNEAGHVRLSPERDRLATGSEENTKSKEK
jgi:hypothetical protein